MDFGEFFDGDSVRKLTQDRDTERRHGWLCTIEHVM
jgi:hypothetical protein